MYEDRTCVGIFNQSVSTIVMPLLWGVTEKTKHKKLDEQQNDVASSKCNVRICSN